MPDQRAQLTERLQASIHHQLASFRQGRLAKRLKLTAGQGATHYQVLHELPDETRAELAAFFDIGTGAIDPHWPEPGLRLFVSHVSDARGKFEHLKSRCAYYGVNLFLAHDNIEGGALWAKSLRAALDSMDAMLTVHSRGFRQSEWTGHEVGYALCRKVPIISLMDGEPPCGFLSETQGFPWKPEDGVGTTETILAILNQSSAACRISEALAMRLKSVTSYNHSDGIVAKLDECATITEAAARQINLAFSFNDQVYESGAEHSLRSLLERAGFSLKETAPVRPTVSFGDF